MGNVRSNPKALQTTSDHSDLFVWVVNAQWTNNTWQGAKANMKRERNAKEQKTAKSQTKSVRQCLQRPYCPSNHWHTLSSRTRKPWASSARSADRLSSRPPRRLRTLLHTLNPFAILSFLSVYMGFLTNIHIRATIASSSTPPTSTARVFPSASPVSAHRQSSRRNRNQSSLRYHGLAWL